MGDLKFILSSNKKKYKNLLCMKDVIKLILYFKKKIKNILDCMDALN